MINLGDIEKRLNDDAVLREAFFKDPVGVLEKEGMALSSKMKQQLISLVDQAKSPKKKIEGSSVGPRIRAEGVDVSINIGKRF